MGGPPAWELGEVLITLHRIKLDILQIMHRGTGRAFVKAVMNFRFP
jgi:hypothetical protein